MPALGPLPHLHLRDADATNIGSFGGVATTITSLLRSTLYISTKDNQNVAGALIVSAMYGETANKLVSVLLRPTFPYVHASCIFEHAMFR